MDWHRSTYCDANACVEVAWHKSNPSLTDSSCVEVGFEVEDIQWAKSSLSVDNGNCVEVGKWKKSTRSGPWTDNCVEVAGAEHRTVLVRDSKNLDDGNIEFIDRDWQAFIDGVKLGEFALS